MASGASSSSRSSDGNSSLFDEGGSASQVPQATVELAGYGSVLWPDSLSEWHQGQCVCFHSNKPDSSAGDQASVLYRH